MFTGIVEKMGKVQAIRSVAGGDRQLMIAMDVDWISRLEPGQSISINGTCLTVTECDQGAFGADVSMETLRVTTLGELKQDDAVNLELPLTLQAPLGGHLVSGHVDGVGIVRDIQDQARSKVIQIEAPMELMRYIAPKGSICIDGVSLTVNRVDQAVFEVNIIPYTTQITIIGQYAPGRKVNLEVDLLARYIESLMPGANLSP